jgi:hypothetical protein
MKIIGITFGSVILLNAAPEYCDLIPSGDDVSDDIYLWM